MKTKPTNSIPAETRWIGFPGDSAATAPRSRAFRTAVTLSAAPSGALFVAADGRITLRINGGFAGRGGGELGAYFLPAGLFFRPGENTIEASVDAAPGETGAFLVAGELLADAAWRSADADAAEVDETTLPAGRRRALAAIPETATPRRLLFCGTGSWEAMPGAFCRCRICSHALAHGGKDVRTRTCYNLGDDLQVDFGPDVIAQRDLHRLDYDKLRYLFISHPHEDHFSPMHLVMRDINTRSRHPLQLVGSQESLDMYRNWFDADPERQNVILREIHAGDAVTLPENGVRLTAVPANHNRGVGAFNYVVETENGAVIFLGTDTGFLKPEAWEILEGFRFDLVVLDCTAGLLDVPKTNSHMSAPQVIEVVGLFREKRLLDPGCRIFTNHISCLSQMTHEESCRYFAPHGVTPAYDGLAVPCVRGEKESR